LYFDKRVVGVFVRFVRRYHKIQETRMTSRLDISIIPETRVDLKIKETQVEAD
jgi:hypothetical protein